jgi:sugar/nucleoside kinase (ribokinase family)
MSLLTHPPGLEGTEFTAGYLILWAVERGYARIVELLVEGISADIRRFGFESSFRLGSVNDRIEIIGAGWAFGGRHARNALVKAARNGNQKAVSLLVGALPDDDVTHALIRSLEEIEVLEAILKAVSGKSEANVGLH